MTSNGTFPLLQLQIRLPDVARLRVEPLDALAVLPSRANTSQALSSSLKRSLSLSLKDGEGEGERE